MEEAEAAKVAPPSLDKVHLPDKCTVTRRGSKKVDMIEKDTRGEGRYDTVLKDTTGNGKFDTIYYDTNGDGDPASRVESLTGEPGALGTDNDNVRISKRRSKDDPYVRVKSKR